MSNRQNRQRWARGAAALAFAMIAQLGVWSPSAEAGRNSYAMAVAKESKAEKMLEKGDNAKAEELFREAIELEPTFPRPQLGLGAALVGQARFEEALAALEQAKEKYVAWDQRAAEMELERRQDAFQARQEFETFVGSKNPSAASAPLADQAPSNLSESVANRLETQGLLTRDRWSLEEIQRIPAQIYYLEGICYLRTGRRDEGVGALELCLALDPDHGLAHYNMAVALFGGGEPGPAKGHLDAALAAGVEAHPQFVADLEKALR